MTPAQQLLIASPRLHDSFRSIKHRVRSPNELHKLLRGVLSKRRGWTFFQAGANDGVLDDPYREFIINQRAHGVLVEPWPVFFNQLKHNYRHAATKLTFLNAAVSYPAAKMTFYSLDPLRAAAHGMIPSDVGLETGLDRGPLEALLAKNGITEDIVVSREVPGYPIEELMDVAGYRNVDVLFLDLEGYESVVLHHYNDELLKPKVIAFESKHIKDKDRVFKLLEERGFTLLHAAKDTIAVREW